MRRQRCLPRLLGARARSWVPDPTQPLQNALRQSEKLLGDAVPPQLRVVVNESLTLADTVGKANLKFIHRVLDSNASTSSSWAAGVGSEENADGSEASGCAAASGSGSKGFFWYPYAPDSPFVMGREAYVRMHHHHQPHELVPDEDVEKYVDFLVDVDVLRWHAMPLPIRTVLKPRRLYTRVVRLVLAMILRTCNMLETEVMGKSVMVLKTPSKTGTFRASHARSFDHRVVAKLAQRVLDDHVHATLFADMGIPENMLLVLYEDLFALTIRIILDVALTFELRCLGHSVRVSIEADEMLHTAPGWDVALDDGTFGRFDDAEKRAFASGFVEDLLSDERMRAMPELPMAVQREMYLHIVLLMMHLAETAINHSRCHVAGMSLRLAEAT